jgi:hypothetical protein
MPYLRGDYARGDYYRRGDPGLFSSIGHFLGTAARVAVPAIVGAVTGGPVGAVIGALKGTSSATRVNTQAATLAAGGQGSAYTPQLREAHAAALAAHRGGGVGIMAPEGRLPMVAGGGGMRRVHPNRSTYVTRGGGTSRWPVGIAVHPKGTELVPSRRMNVANPRALRRALRRVAGFGKIVHRVRRAVSRAASAVGAHRGRGRKSAPRAPSVRVVRS